MGKKFDQIPLSEKLDGVIDQCMEQLQQEVQIKRKRRMKKTCISLVTAAAVFVCIIFFGASNPNAAESIPLLGQISRLMQGEREPAQEYVQESNGVKITVTDITHNYNAISMNVQFYSTSGFPKDMYPGVSGTECGLLELLSVIKFDFHDQIIEDSSYLKGSFTDNHTFTGKISIPIDQRIPANTIRDIKIPKDFQFDWQISIVYDWPHALWEYAEHYDPPYRTSILPNNGFSGTWDFQFHVPLDLNP